MTNRLSLRIGCLALLVSGCATQHVSIEDRPSAPAADRTLTGGEPYRGRIQYRAKDAKPAIMDPTMIAADRAMLAGGTKVIGVIINGEARAYPLFVLSNHQIVNDWVGGTPISASW